MKIHAMFRMNAVLKKSKRRLKYSGDIQKEEKTASNTSKFMFDVNTRR